MFDSKRLKKRKSPDWPQYFACLRAYMGRAEEGMIIQGFRFKNKDEVIICSFITVFIWFICRINNF